MKTIPLFSLLVLLALGCQKDVNDPENEPETAKYKTATYFIIDQPVMYTIGGKITDTAVIRAFVEHHRLMKYLKMGISTDTNNLKPCTYDLTDTNAITMKIDTTSHVYKFDIFSKSSTEWVLISVDSGLSAKNPPFEQCLGIDWGTQLKYYPPEGCRPLPPPSRPIELCVQSWFVPINFENNELSISYLGAHIYRKNSNCSAGFFETANRFNDQVLSSLQNGDTLVVQTKELPLIKIP